MSGCLLLFTAGGKQAVQREPAIVDCIPTDEESTAAAKEAAAEALETANEVLHEREHAEIGDVLPPQNIESDAETASRQLLDEAEKRERIAGQTDPRDKAEQSTQDVKSENAPDGKLKAEEEDSPEARAGEI